MIIRPASFEDAETLQLLGYKTFYDTFASQNSAEDMQLYLRETFTIEKLKEELQERGSQFYIAFEGEVAIGYAKVGNSDPAGFNMFDCLEIERLYVDKDFHGKKVGASLMQQCIDRALEWKKSWLWLGVWEKNQKAISFYNKWGFEVFGKHKFLLGNDLQDDLLMKKAVTPNVKGSFSKIRGIQPLG